MKASELALRAAALISERGHAKKVMEDDRGRLCYMGALNEAIFLSFYNITASGDQKELFHPFMDPVDHIHIAVFRESINILTLRGSGDSPVQFNDDDGTSAEDVILLLKETAVSLEARGE